MPRATATTPPRAAIHKGSPGGRVIASNKPVQDQRVNCSPARSAERIMVSCTDPNNSSAPVPALSDR